VLQDLAERVAQGAGERLYVDDGRDPFSFQGDTSISN
jgi:hypothetical protein